MGTGHTSSTSDKAGIASAILCTVHCLMIPAFFIIKSSWASYNAMQLPEWWGKIDYLFLLISSMAVYHAASHTRSREIKMALWVFWAMLAISIFFEATLHVMAYIASAGLIATHYINIRRTRNEQKRQMAAM